MQNVTIPRPASIRRLGRGAVVVVLLASVILTGTMGTGAQTATPAVAPALAESCATVLAPPTIAGATPASGSGEAGPGFDEIPFDLLASDTLASHDEAVIALLTVALAGSQQPELRQLVETILPDYQADGQTLTETRTARFPDASTVSAEYQTALLDQAFAAAGVPAGSGEAPLTDPLHGADFLCDAEMTAPFDLAAIDLLSSEFQNGVAIGLLITQRAEDPALLAQGQAMVDRETTLIGQLAIWRDLWFGPGAPLVVAPVGDVHEHVLPTA